jgi:hypothetical protein
VNSRNFFTELKRSRQVFAQALPKFEAESAAIPSEPFRHSELGVGYAYAGRKQEAIREGRRAVELTPESRDAIAGPAFDAMLALIYPRVGEADQAIALLEQLLARPANGFDASFEANMSVADLRQRWQWDPLRNDPRFQKILAGPEPKTIYH